MAINVAPTWYIDHSDESKTGLYKGRDSRDPAPKPRFFRDSDLRRRIMLMQPARPGIGGVWEPQDILDSTFRVGVGLIDTAPTGGTFFLKYDGSFTGLSALAYNITEGALQTALQGNTTLTTIATFTANAGTDVITSASPHLLEVGARIRVSNSGGGLPAPLAAGTDYYVESVPTSTTLKVSATSGGAAIDITTAGTGTHTLHKTVTVTKTGQLYKVRWNQLGAQEVLQTDDNLNALTPEGAVVINQSEEGDTDTYEIQTIEVYRKVYAFQGTFTPVATGSVQATTIFAGDDESPAQYQVQFSEPPLRGAALIDQPVPQKYEFRCIANTAYAAKWGITFTNDSIVQGSFVDIVGTALAVRRFWFDIDNAGTDAPPTPSGGSLHEVDVTTANTLSQKANALITAINSQADNSATQFSIGIIYVTAGAVGKRDDPSGTAQTDVDIIRAGTDGRLAGTYFTLANRWGKRVFYFTAGTTTDEPDVEADQFTPIPIVANDTNTAVATAVNGVINPDTDYNSSVSSNVVTITEAFGGERVSITTPGNNTTMSLQITRVGTSLSASVPWDGDPNIINSRLDGQYSVTKTSELIWILTRTTLGEMPNLTASDDTLEFPMVVEGTLGFNRTAVHEAIAEAGGETIAAVLEVKHTPDGGSEEVVLQVDCDVSPDLLLNAALEAATWPNALVRTGKTLWVDSVNGNDATATRGHLEKPYLTPAEAKNDSLSGDTIVVFPGAYTCSASLAKDGVDWYFHSNVTVTMTAENGVGIWDDGGTAMTFNVRGFGHFLRSATTDVQLRVVNISHASSVVKIECKRLELDYNELFASLFPKCVHLVAGQLTIDADTIYSDGASGITFGVWWDNGQLHVHAKEIRATNAAVYSNVSAAPTGDAFIDADYLTCVGTVPLSIGCAGTNATAAIWIKALVINGQVQSIGSNRLYIHAQKIFGSIKMTTAAGLVYIDVDKVAAVANGTSGDANLLYSSISSANARITVRHWDPAGFTGQTIKVTAGTVRLLGGDFTTSTAAGAEITGGTLELFLDKIDASANSGTNPVIMSGGTLVLGSNLYLKAQGARDTVETGAAALTIYSKGAIGNNNVDSAATITGNFYLFTLP
jgi:hypothetical protein